MSNRTNKSDPRASNASRSDLRDPVLIPFLGAVLAVLAGLGLLIASYGLVALSATALAATFLIFCIIFNLTRGKP